MRIKNIITSIAIITGIVILLGAAGGSDVEIFNIEQTLFRVVLGFIFLTGGVLYGVCMQKNIQ